MATTPAEPGNSRVTNAHILQQLEKLGDRLNSLQAALNDINTAQAVDHSTLEAVTEEVKKIRPILTGNGTEGLVAQVIANKRTIDSVRRIGWGLGTLIGSDIVLRVLQTIK